MKAASLWNQPVEKIVQLMAKMVLQDRNSAVVLSSRNLPLTLERLHSSRPLDRWATRSKIVARFNIKHLKHQSSDSDFVRSKKERIPDSRNQLQVWLKRRATKQGTTEGEEENHSRNFADDGRARGAHSSLRQRHNHG